MIAHSPSSCGRMPRFLAGLALWIALVPAAMAQERPPADHLLPRSTLVMISVTDVPELIEKFDNTSIGRMSQDPKMKPLMSDLYMSIRGAITEFEDTVGLSLTELLKIPQGEITFALVPDEESNELIPVLLIDVGKQLPKAKKLVEFGVGEIEKTGVKKLEETVSGTKIITYAITQGDPLSYFEKDATYGISNRPDVLKQILEIWNGDEGKTLSENKSYAAIMQRCGGTEDERPQVIAFVDPIGIMHQTSRGDLGAQLTLAMLPPLGVDGIKGVGASVIFDTAQFESILHLHLLLDAPRSGVLKMIAFEPGDMTPERWVPRDAATYMTVHWDVETTYKELTKVYDSFRGDGAWAVMVQRAFDEVDVNFEEELLPTLDGRLTYVSWFDRPVTQFSQNHLVAVKLDDTKVAQKILDNVVERFLDGEDGAGRETFGGRVFYQQQRPPRNEDDDRPPEPAPCVGILDGYLILTSNAPIYKRAISTMSGTSGSLADELDFKLIASKIKRQPGGGRPAMISFSRPEETMRFLYDLVHADRTRDGLRRGAENNPFLKSINEALEKNPMPPFSVLKRYLAPTGAMVVDDKTGLHLMQFTLRRKAD